MIDNWLTDAANGAAMPDGLPLSEQKAFQSLALLYTRFRSGGITKAQAADEKAQIVKALSQEINLENLRDNLAFYQERLVRATESARNAARLKPSAETAVQLCDALDGIGTFDTARTPLNGAHGLSCPMCERTLTDEEKREKARFCRSCGCRIDWREL